MTVETVDLPGEAPASTSPDPSSPDPYDFADALVAQHLSDEEVVVNGTEWALDDTVDPVEVIIYNVDDPSQRFLVRITVEITAVAR